jgi:putative transposase
MPEYRRAYVPGGTFFFTVVTHQRRKLFADALNVQRLREAVSAVKVEWPFEVVAGVVLLDHLHFIWTLPPGDSDYSKRIGRMKALFTRGLAATKWEELARGSEVDSRRRHGESDVWQRRFWEHTIADERDLEHHFNYLHYNPVKHGLCACPHEWEASSFQYWVKRQVYEPQWCCCCKGGVIKSPYPGELERTVGE